MREELPAPIQFKQKTIPLENRHRRKEEEVGNKETVIKKIENLLDLAGNNPNENEAVAAALKAQELMAKYHVEMADLGDAGPSGEIVTEIYEPKKTSHNVSKWKYRLSKIIAGNFCCKTYTIRRDAVVFYGYEKDAKIAKEVFRFLFETGNRLAERYYRKCRKEGRETKGVLNTFLAGFCDGIKEVLDRQCTALMLVVAKEVEDAYQEHSKGFREISNRMRVSDDERAYKAGKEERRETALTREIEG